MLNTIVAAVNNFQTSYVETTYSVVPSSINLIMMFYLMISVSSQMSAQMQKIKWYMLLTIINTVICFLWMIMYCFLYFFYKEPLLVSTINRCNLILGTIAILSSMSVVYPYMFYCAKHIKMDRLKNKENLKQEKLRR